MCFIIPIIIIGALYMLFSGCSSSSPSCSSSVSKSENSIKEMSHEEYMKEMGFCNNSREESEEIKYSYVIENENENENYNRTLTEGVSNNRILTEGISRTKHENDLVEKYKKEMKNSEMFFN